MFRLERERDIARIGHCLGRVCRGAGLAFYPVGFDRWADGDVDRSGADDSDGPVLRADGANEACLVVERESCVAGFLRGGQADGNGEDDA